MDIKPIKISVIIGVYNMAGFLSRTLDSVLAQTNSNYEIIIMDGGSTDGTVDVIKRYEEYLYYWVSQKDKGHADACNTAIDKVTGDFVFLLNADDVIEPTMFQDVADAARQNPASLVISTGAAIAKFNGKGLLEIIKRIDKSEEIELSFENLLFGVPIINPRFFHRTVFTKFGKFKATHADGTYNLSNDREFLIRLVLGNIPTTIVPKPHYIYLSHDESLTFGPKNRERITLEHIKLGKELLSISKLNFNQKKILKNWFYQESTYLIYFYLLHLKFIKMIKSFMNGFSVEFLWPIFFIKELVRGLRKKIKIA